MTRTVVGLISCGLAAGLGTGCMATPDLTDPVAEVRTGRHADPELPAEATRWKSVGEFRLKNGGQDVEVRVYAADSDDTGGFIWPNILAVYAYYRGGDALWKRAEPWTFSRVGWVGVGRVDAEGVELLFKPKFRINIRPGEKFPDHIPEAPEFSRTLALQQGVPIMKQ